MRLEQTSTPVSSPNSYKNRRLPIMQDANTLIEKIQKTQADISNDLDLLRQKEDEKYADDIQKIKEHQSEVAAEVENLQIKINQEKNGGAE